ncbi:MAG: hypothetical protein WAK12_05120, partial [Acidimicrobiales bacterium]
MRKSLAVAWLMAACWGLALTPANPASGASSVKSGVVLSHVTVTAAGLRGDSAISMTITNTSRNPISLLSITSPDTRSSMIDYDTNMCQGNHAM